MEFWVCLICEQSSVPEKNRLIIYTCNTSSVEFWRGTNKQCTRTTSKEQMPFTRQKSILSLPNDSAYPCDWQSVYASTTGRVSLPGISVNKWWLKLKTLFISICIIARTDSKSQRKCKPAMICSPFSGLSHPLSTGSSVHDPGSHSNLREFLGFFNTALRRKIESHLRPPKVAPHKIPNAKKRKAWKCQLSACSAHSSGDFRYFQNEYGLLPDVEIQDYKFNTFGENGSWH